FNNCAQDWANNMAKQQLFDHRPDNVYGENLYGNQNLKYLGEIAVDSCIMKCLFLPSVTKKILILVIHMTQLLWKKSTKLDVGVSQNPENGMYYVVANYDPKGNLLDHFKENLPEITEEDIEE
ncbi:Golgi-associated plant pathogenesis-related protein 1-like, partial [Aphis craccivora]